MKNLTSGQSAAPDVERHFLDDLVKEMSTFRVAFEQLMGLLATFKSPEASALLDASLKKMDAMNATMALYEDVRAGSDRNLHPKTDDRVITQERVVFVWVKTTVWIAQPEQVCLWSKQEKQLSYFADSRPWALLRGLQGGPIGCSYTRYCPGLCAMDVWLA